MIKVAIHSRFHEQILKRSTLLKYGLLFKSQVSQPFKYVDSTEILLFNNWFIPYSTSTILLVDYSLHFVGSVFKLICSEPEVEHATTTTNDVEPDDQVDVAGRKLSKIAQYTADRKKPRQIDLDIDLHAYHASGLLGSALHDWRALFTTTSIAVIHSATNESNHWRLYLCVRVFTTAPLTLAYEGSKRRPG